MKFIPSPPTDNLYKFLAIFGLWLCTILIVFLGFINYLTFESGLEARSSQNYRFAKERIEELSRRIKAIDEGRYAEDLAKDIPPMRSVKQEREFLERIRTNFQETVRESEPIRRKQTSRLFDQMDAMGGARTIGVFSGVSVLLISLGFLGWYRHVQLPNEQVAKVELKLKDTELLLKQAELRQKEIELKLKEAELRRVEREEEQLVLNLPDVASDSLALSEAV